LRGQEFRYPHPELPFLLYLDAEDAERVGADGFLRYNFYGGMVAMTLNGAVEKSSQRGRSLAS
jgi:hypothetical protein